VGDKAAAMILAPQAAVRAVVRKAVGARVVPAERKVARRVPARLVVDRKAVVLKAAAQAAVRLAAVKDPAAHQLAFQCQAAGGFPVFRVLVPAVQPVAVVASQAAAHPRAALELRAVHPMKAFSEDRVAAVGPPALLVVKRAAKAVKQVAVRPAVLLGPWTVVPKVAWQAAERPVVLLARWAAVAIQVAVCPAVLVNPEVAVKQAELAAMPGVPAVRPAPVRATAAGGALVAAKAARVR
jgi:hypothetical protein